VCHGGGVEAAAAAAAGRVSWKCQLLSYCITFFCIALFSFETLDAVVN
jgi:hypothetical protein